MRHSLPITALTGALALATCSPAGTPLTERERSAVADTIGQFATLIEEGVEALDTTRFAPIFASDNDLTWGIDGQLLLIPRDSLVALYQSIYHGFRHADFTWDTVRVSVLGPEVSVLAGAGHFTVTDTAGVTRHRGVAVTYVFVRRNQKWQLLHGHASHRPLAE